VPSIELIENKGPEHTELRFFRKSDGDEAKTINDKLKESIDFSVRLHDLSEGIQNEKDSDIKLFELWFSPFK
jgi:hypothetical protein